LSRCATRLRLPVNGVLAGVVGNVAKSGDLDLGRQVKVYRALHEVLADPEVETGGPLACRHRCIPSRRLPALEQASTCLCEKPLALNSAQARRIVRAAQAARGFFMPAMCVPVLARLVLSQASGEGRTLRQKCKPRGSAACRHTGLEQGHVCERQSVRRRPA